jgi:hypothetical protein
MPEFHQTLMGREFYEGTMKRLVAQLASLDNNLSRLVSAFEKMTAQQAALVAALSTSRSPSPYVTSSNGIYLTEVKEDSTQG